MITYYVNTNSTAGGNGTTNATVGANRAYASGAEFNTQRAGTMTDDITVNCSGTVSDIKWGVSGWTPAGYKLYVKGNQDFSITTKISTSAYRISGNIGNIDVLFYVGTGMPDTYADHIGFQATDTNGGGSACRCENNGKLFLDACVLETTAGYLDVDSCYGFNSAGATQGKATNCVIRGFGLGLYNILVVYNCTLISNGRATRTLGGTSLNCLFSGNNLDNFGSSNMEYCTTDSASTFTDGAYCFYSQTFAFTDAPNYNYLITTNISNYYALSCGLGPSSSANIPTTSINGVTRSNAVCERGVSELSVLPPRTIGSRLTPIIIDHTKVTSDQTDFPIAICWTGTSGTSNIPQEAIDLSNSNRASYFGRDIRFTSDSVGTKELAFEIVTWIPNATVANAKAEVHVKIPSISSSVDTTVYMWYKAWGATGYSVTDTYGRNNVWSNGYKSVYHLNENVAGLGAADSVGFQDGVYGSSLPLAVAGKMGGYAQDMGYADLAHSMQATFAWTPTAFSVSLWLQPAGTPSRFWDYNQNVLAVNNWGAFMMQSDANGSMYVGTDAGTRFTPSDFGSNYYTDNTWQQFHFTYNGTQGRQFKNGSPSVAAKNMTASGAWGGFYLSNGLKAYVDEVRISSTGRSADWVSAEYANENSPQTFSVIGTAQDFVPAKSQLVFIWL